VADLSTVSMPFITSFLFTYIKFSLNTWCQVACVTTSVQKSTKGSLFDFETYEYYKQRK
jgi:hypothetical protein